jgi:hypothetical protein
MNRAVCLLATAMLIEMVFSAINRALAPYEVLFFRYGGIVVTAILLVCALAERWHRGQARLRTTNPTQPVSAKTAVVPFRR